VIKPKRMARIGEEVNIVRGLKDRLEVGKPPERYRWNSNNKKNLKVLGLEG
jgi:hypothetical protein